jgi:hypothetical protein
MGKKKNQSQEDGSENKRSDKRYLVEKRNILNAATWDKTMTKQTYMLFLLYLSKINPRDINTRNVLITATDYQDILELKKLDNDQIKKAMMEFYNLNIVIPLSKTQRSIFHVFSECHYDLDPATGRYYFNFDASEKLWPFIFNFRDKYFKYEFTNLIALNSCHYIRLYELLKERQYLGHWQIDIDQLKKLMYIDNDDYIRYDNFKNAVLKPCQKTIEQSTDIKFTFEPSARGAHGKVVELLFTIQQNDPSSIVTPPTENDLPVSETKTQPQMHVPIDPFDIRTQLSFISGNLSDATLLNLYQKADGDVALIRKAYNYVKRQKNVEKPIGLLVFLIENPERIGETIEMDKQEKPKNAFINFKQREYDFDELERLELELFKKSIKED